MVREALTGIVRRDEQAYLFHEDAREEVLRHELEASEITVFVNDMHENFLLPQMQEERYPGLFQRSQNTDLTAHFHERQVDAKGRGGRRRRRSSSSATGNRIKQDVSE